MDELDNVTGHMALKEEDENFFFNEYEEEYDEEVFFNPETYRYEHK